MKVLGFGRVGKSTATIIGLILLVAVVAWIGDMVALRSLTPLASSSLDHFSKFKSVGYQKPPYYPNMQDGEAWDMYARLSPLLESANIDKQFVSRFLGGASKDTAAAALVVAQNDSVIVCIKEGVRRKKSTTPINYEEGYALRLPDYMALRKGARLLACRARLNARGDPDSALEDMIDGSVFGQDIAGGDLTLIGHRMGIVCLRISTLQIHHALSQFSLGESQLKKLAPSMNTLAETWPPLSDHLDGEFRTAAVSLTRLPPRKWQYRSVSGPIDLSSRFFYWWSVHLRSWRHLFSFRRAVLSATQFHIEMTEDLARAEQKGWSTVESVVNDWMSKREDSSNWILQASSPNIMSLHRRLQEGVAHARLAGAGALLETYFLQKHQWPDKLELVQTDGLESLLIDPMSGRPLKYIVYPGADSVVVYSIGLNMVDDGGVVSREKGDLVLVLHTPERF